MRFLLGESGQPESVLSCCSRASMRFCSFVKTSCGVASRKCACSVRERKRNTSLSAAGIGDALSASIALTAFDIDRSPDANAGRPPGFRRVDPHKGFHTANRVPSDREYAELLSEIA